MGLMSELGGGVCPCGRFLRHDKVVEGWRWMEVCSSNPLAYLSYSPSTPGTHTMVSYPI